MGYHENQEMLQGCVCKSGAASTFLTSCAHRPKLANTPDGRPLPDENLMSSGDDDSDNDSVATHGPEDEKAHRSGKNHASG